MSTKRLKSASPWLVWSGILAGVGVLGSLLILGGLNRPANPVPVSLVTVEQGDIESTINESGTVELRKQKTIKSPIEGAVDQVLVQPGQRVRLGQTLVTLRFPERQTALANQQLQIREHELKLNLNRQRVRDEQERLAIEERKLKSLVQLAQEGAITRQLFQEQEDRVRTAKIALREAQAAAATTELELERSQLERQRIVQQLQNSVITAPNDAVVLDVKVKDGEGVQLRTDLLTLGDPSQEYVQLRLSTLDAGRVRLNQLARVSVIGPSTTTYPGRIQSLYPQAILPEQNKAGGGQQSDRATVPITVRLDRPTRSLIPGSQVNVEIVLQREQNIPTLPSEAIQRSEAQPFVWIKDPQGKAQKRDVTIGIEGFLNVGIKSGLNPGEQVILPPAESSLRPGIPVTADSPANAPTGESGQS